MELLGPLLLPPHRRVQGVAELPAGAGDPLHELDGATTVLDAMTALRAAGTQIAVVHRADGGSTVVTLADLLSRLMPAAAAPEQARER